MVSVNNFNVLGTPQSTHTHKEPK